MRAVIVILVVLLILALVGWLQFSSIDGGPGVRLNTEKIEQDTSAVVEDSQQAIQRAADKIDATIDRN